MRQHLPTSSHYSYSAPSAHNGAAILSLFCAIIWPLCFLAPLLFSVVTGGPNPPAPQLPDWIHVLTGLGLTLLAPVGIIAGGIGLYRAVKQPLLRASRWLALVGFLLGCLWLAATYTLG